MIPAIPSFRNLYSFLPSIWPNRVFQGHILLLAGSFYARVWRPVHAKPRMSPCFSLDLCSSCLRKRSSNRLECRPKIEQSTVRSALLLCIPQVVGVLHDTSVYMRLLVEQQVWITGAVIPNYRWAGNKHGSVYFRRILLFFSASGCRLQPQVNRP